MENVPDDMRSARFRTVISFVDEIQELWTEGLIQGRITKTPRGNMGFGYDPVFYVPHLEKTFAELSTNEKNKISHRGIALQKLRKILVNVLN
jgi:XTP/dITP diphosphohydrolase